ncbi:MAG: hypothetical protein LBI44_05995 [Oscillospiraceae bacterium]|jgi:DNA-binding NarL/FixJ family response regulator|nr:hypothetical protein [Oscillospiraceae bacterium]
MSGEAAKIKVMLLENDRHAAKEIEEHLQGDVKLDYIGCAGCNENGSNEAKELGPDVVVIDVKLPEGENAGVAASRSLRLATGAKVLLLTSCEHPDSVTSLCKRAFASGCIHRDHCEMLPGAIYLTAVSHTPQKAFIRELIISDLTVTERVVLNHIIKRSMGEYIISSNKTIANQKTRIFKKLGLKNAKELLHVFGNW